MAAVPQKQELNPANSLVAHRVSAHIDPALVQASLRLTTRIFPHEPTAASGLGRAYSNLIAGEHNSADCELVEYFIYTRCRNGAEEVVGGSGFYRLVQSNAASEMMLRAFRDAPPGSLGFLRDHDYSIGEFLWGGRLGMSPSAARSPAVSPFIFRHILLVAKQLAEERRSPPVLLAFTARHDNEAVRRFYYNLGFEEVGVTLQFAGETQDVFALNLGRGAMEVLKRLSGLTRAERQ